MTFDNKASVASSYCEALLSSIPPDGGGEEVSPVVSSLDEGDDDDDVSLALTLALPLAPEFAVPLLPPPLPLLPPPLPPLPPPPLKLPTMNSLNVLKARAEYNISLTGALRRPLQKIYTEIQRKRYHIISCHHVM